MKPSLIRSLLLCILCLVLVSSCTLSEGSSPDCGTLPASAGTAEQPETEAPVILYEDVVPGASSVTVAESELGLSPYCAFAEQRTSVKPTVQDGRLLLTPFGAGEDTVTVYNVFGETAVIHAVCDGSRITEYRTEPFAPPARTRTVDRSALGSGYDLTEKLQGYINELSAAGGGTVYIPAGSYMMGTVSLKNGADVRFEGFVPEAGVGFTEEVQAYVRSGKMAVIRSNGKMTASFFFVNVALPQSYCTAGEGNFTVSGGLFDCQSSYKFLGMSCAENAVFENSVIKDNPNNHAMQIEGCRNVTVRNIMFAGYKFDEANGVLTRETIQIEPTTPGAIGANYDTNVIQCNDGDYHSNAAITVTRCYFGKSDTLGPQLVAVGHHSATGGLVCDGFAFTDNVVDNPRYCGLHIPDTVHLTISGNTFLSTEPASSQRLGTDSALISFYGFDKNGTYTDASGKKITHHLSCELPGVREALISDNTFVLGGGTYLGAIFLTGIGEPEGFGAKYVSSSELRVSSFGGVPRAQEGYLPVTNVISDITVRGNLFRIESAIANSSYYILFRKVNGYLFEDNLLENLSGKTFRESTYDYEGVYTDGGRSAARLQRRKIVLSSSAKKPLTVICGAESTVLPLPASSAQVYFDTDGNGTCALEFSEDGALTVRMTPKEGYAFDGWLTDKGKPVSLSDVPVTGTVYVAQFRKN